MTQQSAKDVWKQILEILDDKLQYGLLEQTQAVSEVRIEGDDLILAVSTSEAYEFFSGHVNQQRMLIMARPVCPLTRVLVERAPEKPTEPS
ncbi:MAG: hypothetical protein IT290_08185 [Deltaproteobacteria bacterium]|nr:hypothetical protein [Deltaproteobacteria bacterium]